MKITIGEVEQLLKEGKTVKVKTINNEYTPIINFINKGTLKTFKVTLDNEKTIKVTEKHKFFTDAGWLETKDIIINKHKILCDDDSYYNVVSIDNIGLHEIVDITVEHPDECYFGNGMLNHNSGKSLLASYALKSTQEKGGLAIYIDTEAAASREYMDAIGVDINKLVYIQLETLEDIFSTIESTIAKVRSIDSDVIVTIVVDSLMGATTQKELDADYGKDGYNTDKAIILSKSMRKLTNLIARQNILLILTNQLRINLQAMPFSPDKYITSGGKAVAFHSSVRLRITSAGKIKAPVNGVEQVVGIKTKVAVVKNRLGPPLRVVGYEIYFDSGIDNYGSWLDILKQYKLVTSGTTWSLILRYNSIRDTDELGKSILKEYTGTIVDPFTGLEFTEADGIFKFKSKDFTRWMEANPKLKEFLYDAICDRLIMDYKDGREYSLEDISIENDGETEHS